MSVLIRLSMEGAGVLPLVASDHFESVHIKLEVGLGKFGLKK